MLSPTVSLSLLPNLAQMRTREQRADKFKCLLYLVDDASANCDAYAQMLSVVVRIMMTEYTSHPRMIV